MSKETQMYEIRTAEMWPDVDYEMRASPEGFDLEGYAAVYDAPSRMMAFPNVGSGRMFREIIHQGAFTKTLAETPDVTLRYQHNLQALPLARTKSGTMVLTEDTHGLRVRATLPDNEWGRPIRDAISRGDVSGMSFRFRKVIDKWTTEPEGQMRHLHEVRLGPEVSVTDLEAYPTTSVGVRFLADAADLDPDELAQAFATLRTETKLTPNQRDVIVAAVNAHADAPVIDVAAAHKQAQMRERLARLAG